MLMDEPFGAIDPINREVIQDEFLKMNAKLGKTVLFVSHDINEAIKMGDKIAIFRDGILEQCDTPDEILSNPANSFVKEFVGTDRALKRLKLIKVTEAIMPFRWPSSLMTHWIRWPKRCAPRCPYRRDGRPAGSGTGLHYQGRDQG